MEFIVRRYKPGDEIKICEVIKKDILTENINDYNEKDIEHLIDEQNDDLIRERAKHFHAYTFLDKDKIVGIGMIGPYWGSLTESSFFTIFRDPNYKGKGLGRKIIETLEQDEYYKRAERVEIPASITAVEFYKHMGFGFKESNDVLGHIVNYEGQYKMEKYPKISNNNVDLNQYNMRPYIENEYHNYKEFIYQVKKEAYKKYVEECWGTWNEEAQRGLFNNFINNVKDDTWIIQLNGVDIGFYNGETLEDGSYEIANICIIPEYQRKGIGTQILKDIMKLHKNQDLHIQYFKQNPVGKLYEKLGFIHDYEKEFHYVMFMPKERKNKV